jgi:hypothetical protein
MTSGTIFLSPGVQPVRPPAGTENPRKLTGTPNNKSEAALDPFSSRPVLDLLQGRCMLAQIRFGTSDGQEPVVCGPLEDESPNHVDSATCAT